MKSLKSHEQGVFGDLISKKGEKKIKSYVEKMTAEDEEKLAKEKQDMVKLKAEVTKFANSLTLGKDSSELTEEEKSAIQQIQSKANAKFATNINWNELGVVKNAKEAVNHFSTELDKFISSTYDDLDKSILSGIELLTQVRAFRGINMDPNAAAQPAQNDLIEIRDGIETNDILYRQDNVGNAQTISTRSYRSSQSRDSAMGSAIDSQKCLDLNIASDGSVKVFGVGAAWSIAFEHHQRKTEERNSNSAGHSESFEEFTTQEARASTGSIDMKESQFRITEEALNILKKAKSEKDFDIFVRSYGSHIATEIRLGGKYMYKQKTTAKSSTSEEAKSMVKASAMEFASSSTFHFSKGIGQTTLGHKHKNVDNIKMANDNRLVYGDQDILVEIDISHTGSTFGMSQNVWVKSLAFNNNWVVIDRPIPRLNPLWELLSETDYSEIKDRKDEITRGLKLAYLRQQIPNDAPSLNKLTENELEKRIIDMQHERILIDNMKEAKKIIEQQYGTEDNFYRNAIKTQYSMESLKEKFTNKLKDIGQIKTQMLNFFKERYKYTRLKATPDDLNHALKTISEEMSREIVNKVINERVKFLAITLVVDDRGNMNPFFIDSYVNMNLRNNYFGAILGKKMPPIQCQHLYQGYGRSVFQDQDIGVGMTGSWKSIGAFTCTATIKDIIEAGFPTGFESRLALNLQKHNRYHMYHAVGCHVRGWRDRTSSTDEEKNEPASSALVKNEGQIQNEYKCV